MYTSMTRVAGALMDGLRRAGVDAGVPVLVQGPGPVFQMWITDRAAIEDPRTARAAGAVEYALFAREMLRRGIRVIPGGRWYLSAAHTAEHVARTLDAGWRDSTIDVDIKMVPDRDRLLRAIPSIKEVLRINVELASPVDFIPVRDVNGHPMGAECRIGGAVGCPPLPYRVQAEGVDHLWPNGYPDSTSRT